MKSAATRIPDPAVEKQLSPAEIDQAERDQLSLRLENTTESLAKRENELASVISAEQNAERLLKLTQASERDHRGERARANEVIAHCAHRRQELEPMINRLRGLMAKIKAELAALPALALARSHEVERLAHQLNAPLP